MKKTITHQPHRAGVVMLEMVIVIMMIGTSAIALYMSLIYGQVASVRAQHLSRASQIATQEMEIIRQTPYANITVPYNGAFIGTTDPVTELPTGTANLTTSVYATGITKAVVTVSWKEKTKTKSVQYTTLVVSSGLGQ